MSIDPLAGKYPWNSPYAFSGNRVIDAVELEGLELLDSDEARVSITYGEIRVKVENFSFFARRTWENTSQNYQTQYTIGRPKTITSFGLGPSPVPMARPYKNSSDPGHFPTVKTGVENGRTTRKPDGRVKEKVVSSSPGSPRTLRNVGRAGLVINILNTGLIATMDISDMVERRLVEEHTDLAESALDLVNESLVSGKIPSKFQNISDISALGNFILQGELPRTERYSPVYSHGTELMDLGYKIMDEAGISHPEMENPDLQLNDAIMPVDNATISHPKPIIDEN